MILQIALAQSFSEESQKVVIEGMGRHVSRLDEDSWRQAWRVRSH